MSSNLNRAIVQTLCYSDVFDYPLTVEEIHKRLIKLKIKNEKLKMTIKNLKSLEKKNKLYFLKGRDEIVDIRERREKYSRQKMLDANKITSLLKIIPSIKLVGITGALAVNNAKENDDIDLFIVTSSGFMWTTRLLVTIIIELTGRRRHPYEKEVNNKICLNMFADENHLAVAKSERDLFSAHEVVQMKPLWDREDTYKRFLQENSWVKKYLPNTDGIKDAIKTPRGWQAEAEAQAMTPPMVKEIIKPLSNILETFLKQIQLWYMRKRRTAEKIEDGIIRFHPHDAREWVLKKYKIRLKEFQIR